MEEIVIDAHNAILGRLASYAAKQALKGNNVKIVNCTGAVVTGNKANILGKYLTQRQRGGSAMNGPNFPSNPSRIMKRTVRGMLPYRQGRGLKALKEVKCYDSLPKNGVKGKMITMHNDTRAKTMTLGEICKEI
ncbi:MAG: 50S ribosomal protein L13 [Nanoarchaeota archaeon]